MKLAILGGTSKLAESFINQVLHHGYDVSALIPHKATALVNHDNLTTAYGSWENESDLRSTMDGCHIAVCMPEVQQDAAVMATFVAAAYEAGVRRVIVVADVLGYVAHKAHLPLTNLLQHTNLDWTIVQAERAVKEDFIAPLHDIATFVLHQINDVTHLSRVVLVRAS